MTLSNSELYRLKSDARRGLLENDLFLQRFFERYGAQLNAEDGKVLSQLLALEDNDLMDLLIGRKDSVAALEKEAQEESFKALKSSAVTERFATDNAVGGGGPSSEYAAFSKGEQAIWSDIVKRAGIKPD